MQANPWSFGDARNTPARLRREYAAWLLVHLPEPPLHIRRTDALREAYRVMTQLMFDSAKEAQATQAEAGACADRVQAAQRRAGQMRTAWEVMHLHIVALELRELTGREPTSDEVEMVLLAERLVEHMVQDIGDRPTAARDGTDA